VLYIQIDTRSQVPVYAQIMDRIRALVLEGQLEPGSVLPAVRQLAADLEINPNTVAKAYSLLEREGLVSTVRRRGTLIAPSAGDAAQRTVATRLQSAIDRMIEEAAVLGVGPDELAKALETRRGASHNNRSKGRSK
jgi:GntR family transcriptional regulator